MGSRLHERVRSRHRLAESPHGSGRQIELLYRHQHLRGLHAHRRPGRVHEKADRNARLLYEILQIRHDGRHHFVRQNGKRPADRAGSHRQIHQHQRRRRHRQLRHLEGDRSLQRQRHEIRSLHRRRIGHVRDGQRQHHIHQLIGRQQQILPARNANRRERHFRHERQRQPEFPARKRRMGESRQPERERLGRRRQIL